MGKMTARSSRGPSPNSPDVNEKGVLGFLPERGFY